MVVRKNIHIVYEILALSKKKTQNRVKTSNHTSHHPLPLRGLWPTSHGPQHFGAINKVQKNIKNQSLASYMNLNQSTIA